MKRIVSIALVMGMILTVFAGVFCRADGGMDIEPLQAYGHGCGWHCRRVTSYVCVSTGVIFFASLGVLTPVGYVTGVGLKTVKVVGSRVGQVTVRTVVYVGKNMGHMVADGAKFVGKGAKKVGEVIYDAAAGYGNGVERAYYGSAKKNDTKNSAQK